MVNILKEPQQCLLLVVAGQEPGGEALHVHTTHPIKTQINRLRSYCQRRDIHADPPYDCSLITMVPGRRGKSLLLDVGTIRPTVVEVTSLGLVIGTSCDEPSTLHPTSCKAGSNFSHTMLRRSLPGQAGFCRHLIYEPLRGRLGRCTNLQSSRSKSLANAETVSLCQRLTAASYW